MSKDEVIITVNEDAPLANKVVSVQTMWKGDDDDVKRIGTREEYQEGGEE
ncbi:MAG: hypothetical protein IJ165_10060 [Proteobacteria bacterium]|nr:hypothetical protein [Pseudomonadota bacterium]